jgi:predicted dehydrogenase/threonine dehydrogenase-like Zn-dependent dehydrogenase
MKQVLIKGGQVVVEDVPAPGVTPAMVLVRTEQSCISVGTELSGLKSSEVPLWKRALKNPEKVLKAFQMVADQGFERTKRLIDTHQNTGLAVGYSLAGTVVAVGPGIDDLAAGDRVACGGASHAMHAEFVNVPRNLVVPVPDGVPAVAASTVTLGAIALQGVRRLAPTLGETIVVIGLGILGQIAVQILKANGCKVIVLDLDQARVDLAKSYGADAGLVSASGIDAAAIARLTGGTGADGVVVTAAASDPNLLNAAFALCRRKGRVVLVGDVPITIDRSAIYRNELEFLISTSYGPGRYDRSYEEDGLDYPVGYVRWTENRNMAAYIDLVAAGKVAAERLISASYPVEEAGAAYAALSKGGESRPLAVTLKYSSDDKAAARVVQNRNAGLAGMSGAGLIRVGLVGAGGFARATHLPNLEKLGAEFALRAVCSATGHQAQQVAKEQKASYATTDFSEILKDPEIDLVVISGRHHEHASKSLQALEAGKHVFVEKPLALTEVELAAIERFYHNAGAARPLLMTGFNRRFSPAVAKLKQRLSVRAGPMVMVYRMNAGFVAQDHWTQGQQGGGRNIGEACHIYDLFTALTDAKVVQTAAAAIGREDGRTRKNENFSVSMRFADGSLASLVYTSLGNANWPKEHLEVYCDGAVLVLDDYKLLTEAGLPAPLWRGAQDKGHLGELQALSHALRAASDWPIPLWQQAQATRISFDVERQLYGLQG